MEKLIDQLARVLENEPDVIVHKDIGIVRMRKGEEWVFMDSLHWLDGEIDYVVISKSYGVSLHQSSMDRSNIVIVLTSGESISLRECKRPSRIVINSDLGVVNVPFSIINLPNAMYKVSMPHIKIYCDRDFNTIHTTQKFSDTVIPIIDVNYYDEFTVIDHFFILPSSFKIANNRIIHNETVYIVTRFSGIRQICREDNGEMLANDYLLSDYQVQKDSEGLYNGLIIDNADKFYFIAHYNNNWLGVNLEETELLAPVNPRRALLTKAAV
jgi:hypothetical protein